MHHNCVCGIRVRESDLHEDQGLTLSSWHKMMVINYFSGGLKILLDGRGRGTQSGPWTRWTAWHMELTPPLDLLAPVCRP